MKTACLSSCITISQCILLSWLKTLLLVRRKMLTTRLQRERTEKEHELEIEVLSELLIQQGRRAAGGEPNKYQELVEGLVDNVRLLARKVKAS